jgi:alkylation response protein AidB-like acyl-CoA dehydrogenase
MARRHSPALYAQFAELGAIGALFPESEGGFGGAGFDISVVFEALGRGLVAEPCWARWSWARP